VENTAYSQGANERRQRSSTAFYVAAGVVVLWLLVIVGWSAFLTQHAFRPSTGTAFSQDWPKQSHLVPSPDNYTVVLFAHPECPCASATLAEMERLRALAGDAFRLIVVFEDDPAFDLSASRNFRQVSGWNNVVLIRDTARRETELFGAKTSGQMLIFNKDRRLLFKGGITESRGHEGDNDYLQQAVLICRSQSSKVAITPVYGCSLY
jgi:hypothetical protein